MNRDYILNEPCFDDKDRQDYYEYSSIIGDKIKDAADGFMKSEITFEDAVKLARTACCGDAHEHTIDLFFVLECAVRLEKVYEEKGIKREVFSAFLWDIKHKLDECKKVKGVFGTFVIEWYKGFLQLTRLALGRLQFDIAKCDQDSGMIGDFTLNDGDSVFSCHIPSGSPLEEKDVIESLKMAHELFSDKLKDGILPVVCSSWLLYPPYMDVFGENSNIANFVRNFKVRKVTHKEKFDDAWRIFGMDYDNNLSELPSKTSLQRNFIEYMKEKNQFGSGRGILLFDGNKVLTRE